MKRKFAALAGVAALGTVAAVWIAASPAGASGAAGLSRQIASAGTTSIAGGS
jgi:hypothetical protein